MVFARIIAFCLMACILLSPALAWNDFAHGVISAIVRKDMMAKEPEAYAKMEKIILHMSNVTMDTSRNYLEAGCWASDMKNTMKYEFWDGWHYVNKPIFKNYHKKHKLDKPNIIGQLYRMQLILKKVPIGKSLPDHPTVERSMMLRMLFHLVGDVHQPCHVATQITHDQKDGDDNGKNYTIYFGNKKTNLHDFWESAGMNFPNVPRPWGRNTEEMIEEKAAEIMRLFPRDSLKVELSNDTVHFWVDGNISVNGIFNQARDIAYKELERYDTRTVFQEYRQKVYQVSMRNLALAGYRLSNLLLGIYGKNFVPFVEKEKTHHKILHQLIPQAAKENHRNNGYLLSFACPFISIFILFIGGML